MAEAAVDQVFGGEPGDRRVITMDLEYESQVRYATIVQVNGRHAALEQFASALRG